MKKIASMVGVGAVVITFGIGSLWAQQQATKPAGNEPAVAGQAVSGDAQKGKVPVPGVEAKTEKPSLAVQSPAKDPKAPGEVKHELTAPAKPADMKPAGQVTPAMEKGAGNTTAAKPGAEVKTEKGADTKSATEAKPGNDGSVKPHEKAMEKTGEPKPVK